MRKALKILLALSAIQFFCAPAWAVQGTVSNGKCWVNTGGTVSGVSCNNIAASCSSDGTCSVTKAASKKTGAMRKE